jgi:signal transduction histidine kinase
LGILIVSHDITKEKQAEIAKQEFIMNMAHDLRTPFSGIVGLAQLQEMGTLKTPEEVKDYGKLIYE